MKKRILMIIALVLTIAVCFSFAACVVQGKSAYDIACENGFVGSQQEWLESLKGTNGSNGQNSAIDINDLFDAYALENPDATFADFIQSLSADNNAEHAVALGIQSSVNIYCTFAKGSFVIGQSETEYYGAGAGVAYKIQGDNVYIITNYHVVYDNECIYKNGIAKTIEVFTYGNEYAGRSVTAEFIGGSITKDIAVIKAPLASFLSNIKAVRIGDSNKIVPGEKVVAIGNPSGKGTSVSVGVISVDSENIEIDALDLSGEKNVMRVIRTDTAINRGNSGGGIFNTRGELLGIVNAKTIASGVENIGYAIPTSVAVGIADSIMDGSAVKCLIGINVAAKVSETSYDTANNTIKIIDIMSVDSVFPDTLAVGKLMVDDKLLSVRINDGETIVLTRIFHLPDYLYKVRPGDKIYLSVERGGIETTIEFAPKSSDFQPV